MSKQSKKKLVLSKIPKRARDEIARIMAERDGALPLHEFLTKRWDVAGFRKSPRRSDEDNTRRLTAWHSQLADLHPELSAEQIETLLSLQQLGADLKEASIARRFALEDPGELARGLALHNRLARLLRGETRPACDFGELLDVCTVRDIRTAESSVDGARPGYTAIPSNWHLCDIAVTAILQKDFETLRVVTERMPERKVRPWMEGIYTCLTGVAEQKPDLVADGLALLLTGIQKMRQKDELEGAINLRAQGLYRLCEWVSPDLVAGFDATQGFPWDAELHNWCDEHPEPLADLDLTSVSPVLHDAVILEKLPAWLAFPVKELYEIVLTGGNPDGSELLQLVGSCAGTSGSNQEAIELLQHCPLVLRWNQPKEAAEQYRHLIEKAGGTAEVRVMARTPFRFCC